MSSIRLSLWSRRRWKKQVDVIVAMCWRMLSELSSRKPRSRTQSTGSMSTCPRRIVMYCNVIVMSVDCNHELDKAGFSSAFERRQIHHTDDIDVALGRWCVTVWSWCGDIASYTVQHACTYAIMRRKVRTRTLTCSLIIIGKIYVKGCSSCELYKLSTFNAGLWLWLKLAVRECTFWRLISWVLFFMLLLYLTLYLLPVFFATG